MSSVAILLISIGAFVIAYVTYGSYLAKAWGVDPKRATPAHELEDGVDYVPAKKAVLMGHHFSSIAGAGPINGPIQAAVFGWVPVLLWIIIGGIFLERCRTLVPCSRRFVTRENPSARLSS